MHPAIAAALIGPRTMDQLEDLPGAAELTLKGEVPDLIDDVVPTRSRRQPRRRSLDTAGPVNPLTETELEQ